MKRKITRTTICLAFLVVLGYLPWKIVDSLKPESWGSAAYLFSSLFLIVVTATAVMATIGIHRYKWIIEPMINPIEFYKTPAK